ncbi:MAG: cobalt-precorrin-6A reductase [Humibacillus sp.]|nr:cobalt-precorrin-6A reductase [Humibacillus sp.]MDN5779127.1 cobalt-precorrin-6A reductase [Humibacillus sp.]
MNPDHRVLLLGGTGEARALAALLVGEGRSVVSSLAGRVSAPALPVGEVRSGGFGGAEGLASYLATTGIGAVVDATHPFAANITRHAALAATASGVPLLRLQRSGWSTHELASTFRWVDSVGEARGAAERYRRPFLTTGRQQLAEFACWQDRYVLARVVDPPDWAVPPTWEVLQARGPFTAAAERGLMQSRRIDVLLTKDSGGPLTEAKLRAATDLDVALVVVRRPALPEGLPVVDTVEAAHEWLARL